MDLDNEVQLMLQLQAGNEKALAQLYERLKNPVYTLALEMLRSREDADEVLQDTFLKLYTHSARYNPDFGSPRSYIYSIARNEAKMRLRKRRSRPEKAAEFDLHQSYTQFEAKTEDLTIKVTVDKALTSLGPEDRRLLEGSFYEGYSHGELSELTGMPLGTLKSRIRRAILKLKNTLGDT